MCLSSIPLNSYCTFYNGQWHKAALLKSRYKNLDLNLDLCLLSEPEACWGNKRKILRKQPDSKGNSSSSDTSIISLTSRTAPSVLKAAWVRTWTSFEFQVQVSFVSLKFWTAQWRRLEWKLFSATVENSCVAMVIYSQQAIFSSCEWLSGERRAKEKWIHRSRCNMADGRTFFSC